MQREFQIEQDGFIITATAERVPAARPFEDGTPNPPAQAVVQVAVTRGGGNTYDAVFVLNADDWHLHIANLAIERYRAANP